MKHPGRVELDGWGVTYSADPIEFSVAHQEQLCETVNRWAPLFPVEGTWVQNEFGVPSVIVRADMTVTEEGNLGFYEIEERPRGIGIANTISPGFSERLGDVSEQWPEFKVVISNDLRRQREDDCLWLEVATVEDAVDSDDLLLVRSEPDEDIFHQFESRSVSSMCKKGDKSYGVGMGWWQAVTSANITELPWDQGFALKPLRGSKARGLCIYMPESSIEPLKSAHSRDKIEDILQKAGTMYCQRLLPPMESGESQYPNMIYRVFAGYSPLEKSWVALGGLYYACKSLIVHGTDDSLLGPIVNANS